MAQGGPGRKELRSIRLKAEATNGTKVAPRFLWRGNGESIDDEREVVNVEEQVGIFGGTDRSYIPKLGASLTLAETEATFEQIADILMMAGLGTSGGGNRAGSAQGASGSTVVFTLPIPTTLSPPTYSCTLEAGDSEVGGSIGFSEVVEYCNADEVKISFAGGKAMMVSAKLAGRQGTFTNAIGTFSNVGTLIAVEEILSGLGTFYLSPVGSGWGTGQVTAGNILGGNVTFKPKWERKYPVDAGVLHFHTAVFTGMDIDGEVTLEHQVSGTYGAAGSAGQVEKWRRELSQLLRMQWPGGAITDGTTHTTKLFQIDLPIKWSKIEALDDQNGNDIRVGKFYSKYNEDTNVAGRGTVTVVRVGTSEISGA